MGTYQAIDNASTPQSRSAALSPSGGSYSGGQATGAGSPQAGPGRSAHFGAGVMGGQLGSRSLADVQIAYDSVLPRKYSAGGAGVLGKTLSVPSALSIGLSPDDPRSTAWNGQRFEQTSPNGSSQATRQASPQFLQQRQAQG